MDQQIPIPFPLVLSWNGNTYRLFDDMIIKSHYWHWVCQKPTSGDSSAPRQMPIALLPQKWFFLWFIDCELSTRLSRMVPGSRVLSSLALPFLWLNNYTPSPLTTSPLQPRDGGGSLSVGHRPPEWAYTFFFNMVCWETCNSKIQDLILNSWFDSLFVTGFYWIQNFCLILHCPFWKQTRHLLLSPKHLGYCCIGPIPFRWR